MFPSLLWLREEPERAPGIAMQVFDDVNLDRLLPESVIKKLAVPCTPEEILARQDIFRRLSNVFFSDAVERLNLSLIAFARVKDALRLSVTEYETLVLFAECARKYKDILNALAALPEGSVFTDALRAFADGDAAKNFLQEFELATPTVSQALERICRFKATVVLEEVIIEECEANADTLPVEDTIALYARKLGLVYENHPSLRSLFPDEPLCRGIAEIYPEEYGMLKEFRAKFASQIDDRVLTLKDEIGFYAAVLALIEKARAREVQLCFPAIARKRVYRAEYAYDISLTLKADVRIIPNHVDFSEEERVCFLTGANGGGKTTYIRTMAINLILFLGGCPIFAEKAEIYPFRQIFTHFTSDERFDGSGRLFDEQRRVDEILASVKDDAFLFLNETFSGTDDKKGCEMTLRYSATFRDRGAFALYVTHFHEVNDKGFPVLNTVIDVSDDNRRTFKIVKSNALRSSYAHDILKKYALTKEDLERRLTES